MIRSFIFICALFYCFFGNAQSQIYGEWVGILVKGKDQYHFEIKIEKGTRQDPVVLNCYSCEKIKGGIIDFRDSTKLIAFNGIINRDWSMNLMDTKIVKKVDFEDELRAHYQFHIEKRNGEHWLIGYWQDYDNKGWKQAQGRIFLKKRPPTPEKA